MSELQIDRLTLQVSGLDETEGRRLALLLSQTLGAAELPPGTAARIEQASVAVAGRPGEDLERLAQRIAREVLRELQRSL